MHVCHQGEGMQLVFGGDVLNGTQRTLCSSAKGGGYGALAL